jgi:hypothetical protein
LRLAAGGRPAARPLLTLVRGDELDPRFFPQLYGCYRSKRQAVEALRALAQRHALCPQALGLESGKGRCFAQQIGQCKGVCCGLESAERHHARLLLALAAERLRAWPYAGPVGCASTALSRIAPRCMYSTSGGIWARRVAKPMWPS